MEPLPQQFFNLPLEIVSVAESLERRLEMPLVGFKPFAPEYLERIELGLRLAAAFQVCGRYRRVGGLAEHVDVRDAFGLRRFKRSKQLIGRARRIALAIRHEAEVSGELGAY